MEIFKFEKDSVTRFIEHELKTLSKFKEPLKYIVKQLERHKNCLTIKSLDTINLNKVKEREGKNYHWSAFKYEGITLVVRRYRQHMTIFTMVVKKDKKDYDTFESPRTEYGAFTLNTNFEKFGDKHDEMMDTYYDKPFTDLNVIVKDLLKMLIDKDGGVHWVWNSSSLKRPDHVELKLIFNDKSIHSIDDFVFCMEELENSYQVIFAENTMVQKLKELKTGEKLNDRYKVGKITTTVKDDYYHAVGFDMIDTMNKGKKSFQDVYSLTRWYAKDIFKQKLYSYNGELYVEGGKFKVGTPVAYKNFDDNVTIFKESLPKENFIPLKKY